VAERQDAFPHVGGPVDLRPPLLHRAREVAVRVQQRLQSLRLLREEAAETQRLLRLGEPLQEDLDGRAELLRLVGRRERG